MLHASVDNRAGPCTNYIQHADIGIGQGATPLVCQQYNAQEIKQKCTLQRQATLPATAATITPQRFL